MAAIPVMARAAVPKTAKTVNVFMVRVDRCR